jgi:MFS family permease
MRRSVFRLLLVARTIRNAAFGALAVVLALVLADRGLDALSIGVILTLALLSGAAFAAATAWLTRRLGSRGTLVAASLTMALAGVLLAVAPSAALVVVAVLLGTVSPTGQDVGPFIPIEQALIAGDDAHGGPTMRRFSAYNIVGNTATAFGALLAAAFAPGAVLIAYGVTGVLLAGVYAMLPAEQAARGVAEPVAPKTRPRWGPVEQLTLLFGVDALAGGFVVQSFLAYWFHLRFGTDEHQLGLLLFGANMLATFSLVVAPWLAKRIGLLPTMVFTHLPSNLLLIAVPYMPTYQLAVTVLLARFALSQMDVPSRQAFTMALVAPEERHRAAGLTNAVRPAAAAAAPVLAGLALQNAAFGLPFVLAGGLKVAYDLALLVVFSRHRDLRS